MRYVFVRTLICAGLMVIVAPAWTAEATHASKPTSDSDESWSYQPPTSAVVTARMIVQQKAEVRAQQRMDRLAAMSWYGTSNSRPVMLGTPFFSNTYNTAGDVPYIRPHDYYEAYQLPFTTRVIER
jgi:hypothetical protein